MGALYPSIPTNNNSFVCEREVVYMPRQAEESILYGVVAENLETFLTRREQRERIVPPVLSSGNFGHFLIGKLHKRVHQ
jgi:hypothetical protein